MSNANFIIDMMVYDDAESTNDPQQRIWDYKKVLNRTDLQKASVQKLVLIAGQDNSITIPASPTKVLYIETDQSIVIKFNGDTNDFVKVDPTSSGKYTGLFFKTGSFTSLSINVPGIFNANVTIFMGI